ncbi:MAG TPA: hypothetical protein VJH89_00410 [Patescibacteria group bacterium]|nr:hypothetical protein [Patescibacteria group bacterium]
MQLKLLIVPFFIIMILVLGIGYIKPDVDVIKAKKAEILVRETQVAKLNSVLANIESLNSLLDTKQTTEEFLYTYLPATLNQEQVIDAFNFFATQSGLAIANVCVIQSKSKWSADEALRNVVVEDLMEAREDFIQRTLINVNAGVPVSAPPVRVRSFFLAGSVIGSYENIKSFLERMTHLERFHAIHLFSLESVAESTNLMGSFEIEYGYVPKQSIPSALSMPIFFQPTLDFSTVDTLQNTIKQPLPVLEKGQTGRPNPFQ